MRAIMRRNRPLVLWVWALLVSLAIAGVAPSMTAALTPTPTTPPMPDLWVVRMAITLENGGCTVGTGPAVLGLRVTIGNSGRTAGPFVVEANGVRRTVDADLPTGHTIMLWFSGYRSGVNVATVDVTNLVAESNETNNSLAQTPPIPTFPSPIPTCVPTVVPTTTTPTPTNVLAPTVTAVPDVTVTTVYGIVEVQATTNLTLPRYTLTVIDSSTGQEQDALSPIFRPSRLEPIGADTAAWTVVANRPGTVTFLVGVSGEIYDTACQCNRIVSTRTSSVPVTVTNGATMTATPTRTGTPTPTGTWTRPSPTSTAYAVSAAFMGSPLEGPAPLTVQFSGGIPPGTCYWDYGDGTTQTISGCSTHTHVYANPGRYTVRLGVTRLSGASASLTKPYYVWVYENTPTATLTPTPTVPTRTPTVATPTATLSCGGTARDVQAQCGPTYTPTRTPLAGFCSVTYRVNSQWGNGFVADVAITNTGTAPISGWTLGWNFANGQQITGIWNASLTQSGASVSARDAGWNGTIAPGSTVSFGFQGTHTGTNAIPVSFTLNGTVCS